MTTILYIEDNDDNIFLFTRRLGKAGYTVKIARDGETGLAMARELAPALILMDLDLPVIDGWEATRRLKGAKETKHIPVIAVSSHAMAGDRKLALAAGCDDFFSKPVEMRALCAKIEDLRSRGSA